MKQVLVLKNPNRDIDYVFEEEVISFLVSHDVKVFILKEETHSFSLPISYLDEGVCIDFAIFLGGDGTILNFARMLSSYDFPFFGINLGRVGVLAEASVHDWKEKVEEVLKGNYYIEKRNTLDVSMHTSRGDFSSIGFNEVSILRGTRLSMMKVHFEVQNQGKASCYADGILVSTSTGSSAYSLSVGGSLILPTSPVFSISPINPQIKTFVPIIVRDDEQIDLSIEDNHEKDENSMPLVVVDGRDFYPILSHEVVHVKKGKKELKIIKVDKDVSLYLPIDKVMKA